MARATVTVLNQHRERVGSITGFGRSVKAAKSRVRSLMRKLAAADRNPAPRRKARKRRKPAPRRKRKPAARRRRR